MKRPALQTLDACIDETLVPVFEANGFKRKSLRRFERQGSSPGTQDVLEVQLGQRAIGGHFCINVKIVEESKNEELWMNTGRLGTWPFSLLRLPQILVFSPLWSLLLPFFWVMLFTDCWWRYSRFRSYTRLAVLDAKWLFLYQALPRFEAAHRLNKKIV